MVACGLFGAAPNESVDSVGSEAGGGIAADVDAYHHVAQGHILIVFVLAVDVDDLVEHRAGVANVVGRQRRALHRDADDDVGPHSTGHVGREVVAQTAVDEHLVAHADGGEDARNGH